LKTLKTPMNRTKRVTEGMESRYEREKKKRPNSRVRPVDQVYRVLRVGVGRLPGDRGETPEHVSLDKNSEEGTGRTLKKRVL